jgi:hypothetical protein
MKKIQNEESPIYDLEERLLDYGAAIINLTRKLNGDFAEGGFSLLANKS